MVLSVHYLSQKAEKLIVTEALFCEKLLLLSVNLPCYRKIGRSGAENSFICQADN